MTRWGLPPDACAWFAALVAIALIVWRRQFSQGCAKVELRVFLAGASLLSLSLSLGYLYYYLDGAPRVIDATSYYLQARTYATGQLGYDPPSPEASHWGRFLLTMPDGRLSVIFPPGYAAFLAFGFVLRAELLVGPLIGAALPLATYWVAKNVFSSEASARWAVLLTVPSAVLRYHTADTMSHGFCALLLLLCVGGMFSSDHRWTWVSGFSLGWLVATRPVTGLVTGLCLLFGLLLEREAAWAVRCKRLRGLSASVLGVGALLWQQRVVTGDWLVSSQYRYYSLADTGPGCFRYGFGEHIGCQAEHGDFVQRYLPDGYFAPEALGTTFRRLAQHLTDAGNQELFALLVPIGLWFSLRNPRARLLGLVIVLQIVAYAGFYFDGNYPGGGARMFAELIPLELIIVAWTLQRWNAVWTALPLMLMGFAFHGAFAHRELAASRGGRPMYEAEIVRESVQGSALIFVDTDHGYNLGFDPSGRSGISIVRSKDPALDFAAYRAAGSPPSYHYHFDPAQEHARPLLTAVKPIPSDRFEFESQWPPAVLEGASAERRSTSPCGASGSLLLTPHQPRAVIEVSLWIPERADYVIQLAASAPVGLVAHVCKSSSHCAVKTREELQGCHVSRSPRLPLDAGDQRLRIEVNRLTSVDFIELSRVPP